MPKNKAQAGAQADASFTTADITELIELIKASELSNGKKMGYLYMIAAGTFSQDAFEGLMVDLEEAGQALEDNLKAEEALVLALKDEITDLENQMPSLQFMAAIEEYQNVDKLVEGVARDVEKEEIAANKAKLKK